MSAASSVRLFRRLRAALTGGLLIAVALSTPAAARTIVDPSTLNPAPPESFNAVCYRTGGHISCNLSFSDPDVVAEPTGIICDDGTELLNSFERSVVGKRIYDADGNLVQRHFRESFTGTFLNPTTGQTALWTQHDTVIHNLAVPGDVTTGTEQVSGLQSRVWVPGGGTILTDAGRLVFDAASGEVLRASGHHPFDEYYRLGDASALAGLCAALT